MRKNSASGVLARHCRLTNSAAFTNVTRFIQRVVNLSGSTYHKGTPRSFTSLRPCWTAILSILTNMYKKYVVNIQESIEY